VSGACACQVLLLLLQQQDLVQQHRVQQHPVCFAVAAVDPWTMAAGDVTPAAVPVAAAVGQQTLQLLSLLLPPPPLLLLRQCMQRPEPEQPPEHLPRVLAGRPQLLLRLLLCVMLQLLLLA
jgi:hypothetical protein